MKHILSPDRNCLGLCEVEESGLLIDARSYYLAFFRAASTARNYILLAGWRFESKVSLVRGEDARQFDCPVTLLAYLDYLCRKNPRLRIYILAWDFSFVYILDREWFLKWKFNRTSSDGRICFQYDTFHAVGASHHQKIAVIDGRVGFVGGIDFSEESWDDSDHRLENPDRVNSRGKPYEPRHDIQAFFCGPAVRTLVDIYAQRWSNAVGEKLELPAPPNDARYEIGPYQALPARRIALSRTFAKTIVPARDSVEEIRSLFLDAIEAATGLIYIENQYFSSQAIFQALVDRMKSTDKPKLQIAVILPCKMHAFYEEMSLGLTQMKMTRLLREAAQQTGHSLGIYWSAATGNDGEEKQTYIHAKVLLVDDRFLSVGSANTTNRSMGLDSELNVSWEADPEKEHELVKAIRRIRVTLLAGHAGLQRAVACRKLYQGNGLVSTLDRLTETPDLRLRRYDPEYALGESNWLHELGAQDLIIDPAKPIIEENFYERIARDKTSLFNRTLLFLREWLRERRNKG